MSRKVRFVRVTLSSPFGSLRSLGLVLGLGASACGGANPITFGDPDAASTTSPGTDAAPGASSDAGAGASAGDGATTDATNASADATTVADATVDATGADTSGDSSVAALDSGSADAGPVTSDPDAGGCVASCSTKACGASDGCGGTCMQGSCGAGEQCVNGTCTCDPGTCAGCCEGTACEPGTQTGACGEKGAVCVACGANTTCGGGGKTGVCGCTPVCNGCGESDGCGGTCNTCGSGQTCSGGQCICDSTSCPYGCCSGSTCMTGYSDVTACGETGGACQTCGPGQVCGSGHCLSATVLWSGNSGWSTRHMLAVDPTDTYLYFIDENNSATSANIWRVPTSGAGTAELVASGQSFPTTIAVDYVNVYWLNAGDDTLMASATGFNGSPRVLASGQYFPGDLAVSGSTLYWDACNSTGSVCDTWEMPTSGGTPTPWLLNIPSYDLAVTSAHIYAVGVNSVYDLPIGSSTFNLLDNGTTNLGGIAATTTDVAWLVAESSTTAQDGIIKVAPTGSTTPTILAVGQSPFSIAIDPSNVYWVNNFGTFQGTILRAPVGGGGVTTVLGPADIGPIALDPTSVYWMGSDGATNGIFKTPK